MGGRFLAYRREGRLTRGAHPRHAVGPSRRGTSRALRAADWHAGEREDERQLAGIAGPLVFGIVSHLTGGSRLSILSLIVFFVCGGVLLCRVDVREGQRVASGAASGGRE